MAVPIVLLAGAAAGAFNGVLVTRLDLPSLVVTLGTLAMFRGVGYIILGSGSVNVFPDALTNLGIDNVPGTQVPWTIVPFLLLAPVFAVVLQHTPTGRRIYALGGNPDAARYAGVRSRRLRFMLFVVSGLVCALAGIVFTARLANARANNALGFELDVITIALLGGISVFGGRGKLTGVVWALVLVATLRNVLGLQQRRRRRPGHRHRPPADRLPAAEQHRRAAARPRPHAPPARRHPFPRPGAALSGSGPDLDPTVTSGSTKP